MPYGQTPFDHPFTGPIMHALEMRDFVEEVKFKREQRQMAREQYKMELEDRQRQRAVQDFNTVLHLHSMGFDPLMEGEAGKSYAQQTGQPVVSAPSGQQFIHQTPTEEITKAREAGTAEGAKRSAFEDVIDPWETVDVPAEFGGEQVPVRKSQRASLWEKIFEKRHPNAHISQSTNATGDVVVTATDPRTGKQVNSYTIKGAGKPSATKATDKTGLSSQARIAMEKAQKAIDEATPASPSQSDLRTQNERWKAAKAAVAQAVAAYPGELEGGPGAGGYPFIMPKKKGGSQTQSASTNGKAATGDKVVKASQLGAILGHSDVKKRGIKDLNALRKDLVKNGYEIVEDQ